jgi:type IV pilus assembly protein PilV
MPLTRASGQCGFTLLEILVAIVVLSIGLLGLAGLQAVSLNNNQVAYYRAIATQQAYDMADRMRANLGIPLGTPGAGGVRAGDYDNLGATTPPDPGCLSTGCTATQMRTTDHFQWNTMNARLLPVGVGTVTGNGNGSFDINVSWTEKTATGTVTRTFLTTVTP